MSDPLDESTRRGRRTRSAFPDATVPVARISADAGPEGSMSTETVPAARRAADAAGPRRSTYIEADLPGDATAATPPSAGRDVFRARVVAPAVVARTAEPPREPQASIDPADAPRSLRRHRRTALIVVSAASAVAVVGAVSLAAVALIP